MPALMESVKIIDSLLERFSARVSSSLIEMGRLNWLMGLGLYIAFLLPIITLTAFSYHWSRRDLTQFTRSRRQTFAYLAATTTKEKLDHLSDLAVSLATRVRFRQLVGEGRWEEAVAILRRVPHDFPFIDRIFLTDPAGTLMADTPHLPGVRGRNFAFRDWYLGVSSGWRPYISGAYKRTAEPRVSVVAAAVPIPAEKNGVAGILVLQVQLVVLLDWIRSLDVGPGGILYIVDRKGGIVAHPKLPLENEVIDFSRVPPVERVLRGEAGVDVFLDPGDDTNHLSAYHPVPTYGWGIIVTQPADAAFAVRDNHLKRILVAYGLAALFGAVLAYGILRALVQHRRAAESIRRLNKDLHLRAGELENANKELEAFSYSVSHDLRAPLRAIDGFSRILVEKQGAELSEEGRRYLSRVRDNAKQMGHLIDDLLTFSRLSRQPLKTQWVFPADIARQALQDQSHSEFARSQAEISIGTLPACLADPSLLKQVYSNLLSNALKFTRDREKPKIEVGFQNGSGEAVYFVRDNGVGFDMQYADKLFGVFQRLHRAEEYEGTGVGLAIVQRVVHRHGGRVWAEAGVDRGTTFYFTLGGGAPEWPKTP